MTAYSDIIRKYAADTSRAGTLENADGTGEVGLSSAEVGRRLAVRFVLHLEQERIVVVRYQVFGCGFTMAACAAAAELAEGQRLSDAAAFDIAAVNRRLGGLPDERSYCAALAVEALQAAVSSVRQKIARVAATVDPAAAEPGPRLSAANPLYRALIDSPAANRIEPEDRQLFACLLAVADSEPCPLNLALGLAEKRLDALIHAVFPRLDGQKLFADPGSKRSVPPAINPEVLTLLLSHVPATGSEWQQQAAAVLARIIAARAAHPGHLWTAMGLFERPQLSAAIGRHLPSLAAANNRNMRWKRYLFKQVCDRNGGVMCKVPNCGVCSDYSYCFAEDD